MRVLIIFALVAYAVAAPSLLKEAEDDASIQKFNPKKSKAVEQSEKIQNTLVTSSRRFSRSTGEIESSTVADDVTEGVSEANDLAEELAEEAHWAAEEKKWQEQAEVETASARLEGAASSIETTTISENENEEVDESNDLSKEITEEKQWAEEEKKWQEQADADTEAAALDGNSASKEGDSEQSDIEEIENVENTLPAAESKILNDLPKYEIDFIYPQFATITNYNFLRKVYPEAYNPWGYQFARVYHVPEIYSPY